MTISSDQRHKLAQRAKERCEYCLLHQDHGIKKHEPDHIIPKKHGGQDLLGNLAWACFQCNRYKGSEVAAFDQETGELTALFNPRHDQWTDHFSLNQGFIQAKTAIGRVTILVLQLNRPGRIQVRNQLSKINLYP